MKPQQNNQRRGGGRRGRRPDRPKDEFDSQMIDLSRVTRVTKGGKQLSFRACIVVGDRKGRVGEGTAKGKDVQIAIEKATRQAKKNLFTVTSVNGTIPHAVIGKFGAAKVLLKPAPKGSGLISGGPVRMVFALAGIESASSKIMGSNNKINIVRATLKALQSLRAPMVAPKKKAQAPAPETKEKVAA